MTPLRARMIEDMTLAGFAPRTQEVYLQAVRRLAAYYKRSSDVLSEEEVRAYVLHLRDQRVGSNLHLVERWTRTGPTSIAYEVTVEDPTVWTRPWTVKQEYSRQSDEENRLYTEPRCIEGNQGLPGLLHGRRVEELAFAERRGPDPATQDNTADFASTAVLEDPLQ
jgi:hypothetical protein